MAGFAACFADLIDPRTGNAARHDLLEMLVIALCSVLTGGEDCTVNRRRTLTLPLRASNRLQRREN